MPGMGMNLVMHQRLDQRLEQQLQLYLDPGDLIDPFRTDAEVVQISQYEILKSLDKLIDSGEFFDTDHFGLEINRTIFGNPLEARLGNFGRDLSELVRYYQSDDALAKQIITILSAQKEEGDKKDIPGKVASAWNVISQSDYFKIEPKRKRILTFVEGLNEHDADIASGLDIVSKAAELKNQKALVDTSFDRVQAYSQGDVRIIPFAQAVLSPVIRSLGYRKERLTAEESVSVYESIVETLYMIDRDLRTSGTIEKISYEVQTNGVRKLLESSRLPIPIQVFLDSVQPGQETYQKVLNICSDSSFAQGREVKRKIYKGLAAIEDLDEGRRVLDHIVENLSDSKGFARVLSVLNLVYSDPDFSYPYELKGEDEVLKNLKFQLVDKSIKRLELNEGSLEKYLARLESDERFERISKIITTLAGYSQYQNPQQTGLLREIIEVELEHNFIEWRYSHDKAQAQLKVLGDHQDAWKKNSRVTRLVGELQALDSHIDSIKNVLPKIMDTYADYYGEVFDRDTAGRLEARVSKSEERLRGDLSKKEKKELGYHTSLLREQLDYVRLLSTLSELNADNYNLALQQAGNLAKKRSRNPLYENARWVRETLDQPEYRDARKITVYETDDLETLLRFGESPVPHCQNWKADNSLNKSLPSFVADANKKPYYISNGNDKPISMSLARLVDWQDIPTILIENVYDNEWSDDYGIALLGSLADKAVSIHKKTRKEVRIATNDQRLSRAMKRFSEKYKVEIMEDNLDFNVPESKNTHEYFDCGPGLIESGSRVSFDVKYISFGSSD